MRFLTRQARQAFRIVWLAVSLIILATLAAPFVLGRERLANLVPVCEWKAKYHRPCPFCGMTTSFVDISEGRFSDAKRSHRAGIPLYLLFVSNELGALVFARRKGFICKL